MTEEARNILDEPQDITFITPSDEALTAASAKTDDQKAKPLERYWTQGKGLARWADSATPFRTLVSELRKEIPADEMTPEQINGLAATYYRKVKGEWPGKRGGDKKERLALAAQRVRVGKLALLRSRIDRLQKG
ncbi:hypothetical protein [Rhodococcoides kyotonense]|uniref:Uncharacterized protein n=1 Tax=Rhodococcoides kyotonense TaxID=398843 RepID=A0A239FPE2_9NOCA|nr:hypothetical protein [Rhodococcus kyotonensis]SNS58730.1 hypothetical protein SAMN05421642_103395 [Rhodococcus kyotonensis]